MFLKLLSLRLPALLTRMSRVPKWLTASSTIDFAPSRSDTDALLAIASPPFDLISSTTRSAASPSPDPSRVPPRSFTTTFAPCSANASAWARPRPLPAPVTITTLPSKSLMFLPLSHLFDNSRDTDGAMLRGFSQAARLSYLVVAVTVSSVGAC